jgi:hypothetical protein
MSLRTQAKKPSNGPLPEKGGHTMAARLIASMTLSFGLVLVPVKVYTATESKSGVGFNLMHKECGTRLRQ